MKEKENDKILSGCVFFSLIILPYNINAYSQSILSVLQVIFHAHIFSVLLKMNNPFAFEKIMMRNATLSKIVMIIFFYFLSDTLHILSLLFSSLYQHNAKKLRCSTLNPKKLCIMLTTIYPVINSKVWQ